MCVGGDVCRRVLVQATRHGGLPGVGVTGSREPSNLALELNSRSILLQEQYLTIEPPI